MDNLKNPNAEEARWRSKPIWILVREREKRKKKNKYYHR